MDSKDIWGTVGVREIRKHDDRGKIILQICADIFGAIRSPNHRQHADHKKHSRDALRSILSILSEDTILVCAEQFEWEKPEADRAQDILNKLIEKRTEYLMSIVYRSTPRLRRRTGHTNLQTEDMKIGCIMGSIFDFEVEAEEHVEEEMEVKQGQLPKK